MEVSVLVISVGDIMLDIYIQEPDSLNPDTDTEGSTKLMWGGSAANFAVWASRLGLNPYINGKVGSDFLGDAALEDFRKEGVKALIARDANSATGTVVVKSRGADGREMICDRKANAKFSEEDLPADKISTGRLDPYIGLYGHRAKAAQGGRSMHKKGP